MSKGIRIIIQESEAFDRHTILETKINSCKDFDKRLQLQSERQILEDWINLDIGTEKYIEIHFLKTNCIHPF